MSKLKCEDCKFWERLSEPASKNDPTSQGFCRRYAPKSKVASDDGSDRCDGSVVWPVTGGYGDWCGEFVKLGT